MKSAATSQVDLVVFKLAERRYALALGVVERVVHMVAVTAFPKGPEIVSGVIDLQGELIPVMNVRARFGLGSREGLPSDQLIIARTARRRLALAVDAVDSVVSVDATNIASPESIVPGLEHVRGLVQLPEGLVLVHDLDTFLSLDEDQRLTVALEGAAR